MQNDKSNSLIFSGTSHPALAKEVADLSDIALGRLELGRFPDGEISLRILDDVQGKDVFVLQSIALEPNDFLMELLIIVDALTRASAKNIVAVVPYFGYSRQDRQDKSFVPITTKLVANLLEGAGVTRVITMDLHAGQIQGFFDIPVDNLLARRALVEAAKAKQVNDLVVVTPDIGSFKLARDLARELHAGLAVVDKQRLSATEVETVTLIGNVKGKVVLLADDMCTTGGTFLSAAKACQEKGAERIFAIVTHGLFVRDAIEKIEKSPIEALYVSNTVPCKDRVQQSTKIKIVSIAPLLAHAVDCIIAQKSIFSSYE